MTTFNTLTQFAQATTTLNTTTGPSDAAVAAALALFVMVSVFFGIIAYVFMAVCLMKIFKKAGVPQWAAWVPFYNTWKTLEIGGQQGLWAILAIFPILNIVAAIYIYIAMYHIGKKLGKGSEFVLWAILLPFVWYPWLAFDKSTWNDAASTAPSLHNA